MSIKLSQLKNFDEAWPKKRSEFNSLMTIACQSSYNNALSQCSSIEVGLDREALAKQCHKNSGGGRGFNTNWKLMCDSDKNVFMREADNIIKNESSVIKICKKECK